MEFFFQLLPTMFMFFAFERKRYRYWKILKYRILKSLNFGSRSGLRNSVTWALSSSFKRSATAICWLTLKIILTWLLITLSVLLSVVLERLDSSKSTDSESCKLHQTQGNKNSRYSPCVFQMNLTPDLTSKSLNSFSLNIFHILADGEK